MTAGVRAILSLAVSFGLSFPADSQGTLESKSAVDDIYIVNLERSKDRLLFMQGQLSKEHLTFTRIEAVDGKKDINLEELEKKNILKFWEDFFKKKLSAGEAGNYLSHRKAWSLMLKKKHDRVLVLEDDIVLPKNFESGLANLMKDAPKNWEILYLGCGADKPWGCGPSRTEKTQSEHFVRLSKPCYAGNYAYIVSKTGARKLLRNALPLFQPTDGFVSEFMQTQLTGDFQAYCANPEFIKHNYDVESIIGEYGRK